MTPAAARATGPGGAEPTAGVADLHTHTTASDGLLPPAELVAEAKSAGLSAIGVTDHDTVDGIADAVAAGGSDLQVVPGIELSAALDGREPHILGYFVDPESDALLSALADFRLQREQRMHAFAARLTEIGLPVAFDEIAALSGDGAMGRPHLAAAMIRRGYVADVPDAFARYLSPGTPGFVPKREVTPETCIGLIREAGGVAVLAHPFSTGDPEGFAVRLKSMGMGGLEVEYGSYDEEQRATLRAIAARHGLLATGGSDYHGPMYRHDRGLGGGSVPMSTIADLARLAGR